MCYNSNRSAQPSPCEQIALPTKGLNYPCSPIWSQHWEEGCCVAGGGGLYPGRQEGEKLLQGFLCISLLFLFLPRLAAP